MSLTLPDARVLSDEVLEALRVRAIHGCESGYTQADVAALLGVAAETVCRWWTAYAGGGLDALPGGRTGRPVGSGRTLSDDQARRIRLLIDGHGEEFPLAMDEAPIATRSTHGTGCALSAALAALLSLGHPLRQAAAGAKQYVTGAIRHAPGLGNGHGPIDHAWLVHHKPSQP